MGDHGRELRRRAAERDDAREVCASKVRYGRRAAQRAARILRREHNEWVHVYPCGGHYHVGHTSQDRPLDGGRT